MRKRYVIVLTVVLLGFGLFFLYPATPKEKFDKYYALWKSHDIKRYAYTLIGSSSSYGPDVLRITVYHNKIINIYRPHDVKEKVSNGFPAYTIDDKFHDIAKKISKQSIASYDKIYGFPKYNTLLTHTATDTVSHIMLGEGYSYQIKNFRVLPIHISKAYQPVCAKDIIIKPCMDKICPVLSSKTKTYQNKDMMDIAGAYFIYKGVCEKDT